MSDFQRYNTQAQAGVAVDEGLRSYMLGVYNYMAFGIAFTAIASFGMATWASANPAVANALYASPLRWVLMFAPLAFIFLFSATAHKMKANTARLVFFAFAGVMGVSMSWIFMVFNLGSIVQIFAITSAAFAGLSLWGYTTKKDISGWGSFLIMGVIGIILASIVNIFLGSGMLSFAINVIGVLLFAGLTAYDTQDIKNMYFEGDSSEVIKHKQVNGALRLYLDFINMFMMLLQLLGNRE